MPIYQMKCSAGHVFDKYMTIAQMEGDTHLCDCGIQASVQITPTMLAPMFEPYRCPVTDQPITSKHAHTENLKRQGCRVYEPGETNDFNARKEAANRSFDKSVEKTVETFVDGLSGDKREQLVKELQSGASVSYERKAGI